MSQRSFNHRVEPLDLQNNLEDVLRLVSLSSQSDPSCRTHHFSEDQYNEMEPFIRQSCEEKLAFVVRESDNIIGIIILFKQGPLQENVCVGFVGVHPNSQGQGISNLLYFHALNAAQKLGYSQFIGFSSTQRVLSQNEKLSRKIKAHHFILSQSPN